MESIKQYPANVYYGHNRTVTNDDLPSTKQKDYALIGMALCLPAFLGTALVMTVLSMTLLYRWIPEILLIVITLSLSIASLFGTLKYFFGLDKKQWGKR